MKALMKVAGVKEKVLHYIAKKKVGAGPHDFVGADFRTKRSTMKRSYPRRNPRDSSKIEQIKDSIIFPRKRKDR